MPHIAIRNSRPSNGAMALRQALGDNCRLTRREVLPRRYRHVFNWGSTNQILARGRVWNHPDNVKHAINKLTTLRMLSAAGVRVPEFWSKDAITKPVLNARDIWLARNKLAGSGGDGIEVLRTNDAVRATQAHLLVKYIPKLVEMRIHVVDGEAIALQFKKRESTVDQTADQRLIRNHNNGWVFCPRELTVAPVGVVEQAVNAVRALGLDFGAVDIIIGKRDSLPYVLEVNTAPGLESPTVLEKYTAAISTKAT